MKDILLMVKECGVDQDTIDKLKIRLKEKYFPKGEIPGYKNKDFNRLASDIYRSLEETKILGMILKKKVANVWVLLEKRQRLVE